MLISKIRSGCVAWWGASEARIGLTEKKKNKLQHNIKRKFGWMDGIRVICNWMLDLSVF